MSKRVYKLSRPPSHTTSISMFSWGRTRPIAVLYSMGPWTSDKHRVDQYWMKQYPSTQSSCAYSSSTFYIHIHIVVTSMDCNYAVTCLWRSFPILSIKLFSNIISSTPIMIFCLNVKYIAMYKTKNNKKCWVTTIYWKYLFGKLAASWVQFVKI